MPQASCAESFLAAEAQARERGTIVVGIIVRCIGVCTAARGEAERSVSYGDGTSEQGRFGWQAAEPAPVAPPEGPEPTLQVAPTCVGIEAGWCESVALDAVSQLEPGSGDVVSIVVNCTLGPCTQTSGDGETTVTFADGQVITSGWAYRGGP
jgi:hypothetical protein